MGLLGASPRNRRLRRRSENETREEKVSGLVEEVVKPRKRRSKKEKLDLVLSLPSPSSSSIDDEYRGNLDRSGQLKTDLIMWRDVARSSLWLGLGSLFFLSSCFAKGINFSIFSGFPKSDFCFWVFHLSPIQSVKGEPSMTLQVAPFFLLGAESGHLITFWRLCMLGMPNF